MSLVISGSPLQPGWRKKESEADFFFLKKYVDLVIGHLGIKIDHRRALSGDQWEHGLGYAKGHLQLVSFGKISRAIIQQYDLKNPLFFADFWMTGLLEAIKSDKLVVEEIPRFPAVYRDIAIVLAKQVSYGEVEKVILDAGGQLLTDCSLFDVYENAEALGKDKKSLAISLVFQDPERTLTDSDIQQAVKAIVSALAKETGAVLR